MVRGGGPHHRVRISAKGRRAGHRRAAVSIRDAPAAEDTIRIVVRCSARRLGSGLAAAAVLAGCGSSDPGRSANTNDAVRTAVERGLLSSVRTAPGVGSVTAVHCIARGTGGRRWTCRLVGDRPQTVAVTVRDDGWWSADGVRAAPAPQMSANPADAGDGTRGEALTGCCVPRS